MAPVILPMYEIDELMDATLVRQKAAQAVGWIIKKLNSGALPLMGDIEADTSGPAGERIQKIRVVCF